MSDTTFDCVIIGSGPGGYVAAIRAAQLGMKTAVVEKDKVGGRCLNYACIPAKAVLRCADLLGEMRDAADYGLKVTGAEADFGAVAARREKVISTLTGGVASLLKKNGVELITGSAALAPISGGSASEAALAAAAASHGGGAGGGAPASSAGGDGARNGVARSAGGGSGSIGIVVDGRDLSARTVVLATGSVRRSIPGVELGGPIIGTEEAWALDELPRRLAVVGAGASGAEIASGYARLGSEVLLIEVVDRVLPSEDADISRLVERGLKRQGIRVLTSTSIADVKVGKDGVSFTYGAETATVDKLVIAAGRAPDVEALALADAGVEFDERGCVKVDVTQRTSRDGVYAIGDLVRGPALAHKASEEGVLAVEDAAGLPTHPLAYVDIPRATFCTPNVGSFGLTEDQAREQDYDVVVGKVPYGAVGGGIVYGDRSGLVKVIGDRRYGELLGGHIVGSKATELIQELVNVRALEGGFPEVARIVHGHPTLSEAVMEAGRAADGWLIHG